MNSSGSSSNNNTGRPLVFAYIRRENLEKETKKEKERVVYSKLKEGNKEGRSELI